MLMRRYRRARRNGVNDAGMTVVEMMVALSVLVIGIVGVMQAYYGSMKATAFADARTRGTALATREVEAMRADPYDKIGFTSSQPGFRATFEGLNTVTVSSPGTTPIGATETIGGVGFGIRRDIVWVPDGANTQAYKRAIAVIIWKDLAGWHEVRQDAGIYPGGFGPIGASTTSSSTTTTSPAGAPSAPVSLTGSINSLAPFSQVDLSWTIGTNQPTTWEVQWSKDAGATWVVATTTQPGGSAYFTVQSLSSSTTYRFRVRGLKDGYPPSSFATVNITTATPSTSCVIGSANATPSTLRRRTNGTLRSDFYITVNTTGTCTGLKVKYPNTTNAVVLMSLYNNTYWDHVAEGEYTWAVGTKIIQILSASNIQLATISLFVTN